MGAGGREIARRRGSGCRYAVCAVCLCRTSRGTRGSRSFLLRLWRLRLLLLLLLLLLRLFLCDCDYKVFAEQRDAAGRSAECTDRDREAQARMLRARTEHGAKGPLALARERVGSGSSMYPLPLSPLSTYHLLPTCSRERREAHIHQPRTRPQCVASSSKVSVQEGLSRCCLLLVWRLRARAVELGPALMRKSAAATPGAEAVKFARAQCRWSRCGGTALHLLRGVLGLGNGLVAEIQVKNVIQRRLTCRCKKRQCSS